MKSLKLIYLQIQTIDFAEHCCLYIFEQVFLHRKCQKKLQYSTFSNAKQYILFLRGTGNSKHITNLQPNKVVHIN